ncbi:hypothetical protein [Lyngbya aestuarii]|nr:hypothetical protein [Lyngbya aestuarii]
MLIYDFHLDTLNSKHLNSFNHTLNLIKKFWKFSNYYGNFIATSPDHRQK